MTNGKDETKPKLAVIKNLKIDAAVFKDFLAAAAPLLDEIPLQIDKDGITLKTLDPSGIAAVSITIPKTAFETYDIATYGSLNILDPDSLLAMFRGMAKGTSLVIKPAKNPNHLDVSLGDQESEIQYGEIRPGVKVEDKKIMSGSSAQFEIDAKTLKDILAHIKAANASYMTIEAANGKITFSSVSDTMKYNKPVKLDVKLKHPTIATYNYGYISKMLKGADKGSIIKIRFGTDEPLVLEYDVSGKRAAGHEAAFMLAPYCEGEGERASKYYSKEQAKERREAAAKKKEEERKRKIESEKAEKARKAEEKKEKENGAKDKDEKKAPNEYSEEEERELLENIKQRAEHGLPIIKGQKKAPKDGGTEAGTITDGSKTPQEADTIASGVSDAEDGEEKRKKMRA